MWKWKAAPAGFRAPWAMCFSTATWTYFQDRYKITVLPELDLQSDFPGIKINRLFDILCKKTSFGDALMISFAEKYLSFVSTMVTWDSERFKDKFAGKVLTPDEFLAGLA
jgi:hypothetical protein